MAVNLDVSVPNDSLIYVIRERFRDCLIRILVVGELSHLQNGIFTDWKNYVTGFRITDTRTP